MYCCCHVDLPRLNHGLFYFSIIFSQRIEALGERKNSVIIEVEESKVVLQRSLALATIYYKFTSSKYCYEYHIIDFFKRP